MKIKELEIKILEFMLTNAREKGTLAINIKAQDIINIEIAPINDYNICFESLLQKDYIKHGIKKTPTDNCYNLTAFGVEHFEST